MSSPKKTTRKKKTPCLNRIISFDFSQRRIKQLEGADFGTFTALWWPDAPLGRLEILAYLVLWLFTWDDEIDEPTGAYSADFSGAQQYRKRTLRFVGECLGLSSAAAAADDDDSFRPQNEIVQSFDVVGAALRSACTVDQCQRFYDEIARFMQCSEDEQRGRLRGHIPSLDEYWHFRLGTSAVYIGTAVGEYATGMPVPPGVMRSAAVQGVWDETNVIISITNDLMSLRKEMKLDGIDSIVPLTFSTTGNVQQAVSQSVDALRASKERFDTAAEACLALCRDDDAVRGPVEAFIETQRSNCVGNLVWRQVLDINSCSPCLRSRC